MVVFQHNWKNPFDLTGSQISKWQMCHLIKKDLPLFNEMIMLIFSNIFFYSVKLADIFLPASNIAYELGIGN